MLGGVEFLGRQIYVPTQCTLTTNDCVDALYIRRVNISSDSISAEASKRVSWRCLLINAICLYIFPGSKIKYISNPCPRPAIRQIERDLVFNADGFAIGELLIGLPIGFLGIILPLVKLNVGLNR